MKAKYFIIAALVLFSGCSESDNESEFSYPKSADTVQMDADYKLVYTGEESGISYYLKQVDQELAVTIADDNVASDFLIEGEEESFLYVAIKDDEIIMKPPIGDIVSLGYKLTLPDQE